MKNMLRPSSFVAATALAAALSACTPNIDLRGNLPDPEKVAAIKIGTSTRDDIQAALGTPSTVNTFGEETWNYIWQRTERVAFFSTEITDRKVLTLVFDRKGLLKDMNVKGLEDGKDIQVVDRETPSAGKEMTVLQQMIGNVGRFSKDPSPR
jgi:outer membrane protein assembly factor BamE (lipoprotein component of BamABCDE complex)